MYGSVLLPAGLYRVNPLDYLPLDIHYGTPRLVLANSYAHPL